ncbi:nitrate reductase [Beijerinckiaceae bacterium]|nr:nitrate reductase [Beijerinckiaceae bacterium]
MTSFSQTILMCPPDHFEVAYVINPWMEGQFANTDAVLARQQWDALRSAIGQHAKVVLEPPQRHLPDIVFTANAGLVLGKTVIVSRFRSLERQGEERHHRAWFAENGFSILDWPQEVPFEGAGDALFDRGRDLLWVGHGFRSDAAVPLLLEKLLGRKTAALNLVDPLFYHLDTCLCPLTGGSLMYFPAAFDEKSRALIESLVPRDKRIAVEEADALKFCCNAVDLDSHVFMNDASENLQSRLRSVGFQPVVVPLSEFMKAGGAAKCLTLKLVET